MASSGSDWKDLVAQGVREVADWEGMEVVSRTKQDEISKQLAVWAASREGRSALEHPATRGFNGSLVPLAFVHAAYVVHCKCAPAMEDDYEGAGEAEADDDEDAGEHLMDEKTPPKEKRAAAIDDVVSRWQATLRDNTALMPILSAVKKGWEAGAGKRFPDAFGHLQDLVDSGVYNTYFDIIQRAAEAPSRELEYDDDDA